jgi:integrase
MPKRKRHQKGSLQLRKVGKHKTWLFFYYENGRRRCKTIAAASKLFTKSQAEIAAQEIMTGINGRVDGSAGQAITFEQYVLEIYLPYCKKHRWKNSTTMTTENRIKSHLVDAFGDRQICSLRRQELQEFLENKAARGLSFSIVDHLRWDLRSILELAADDGYVERNPAGSINTPRQALPGEKRVMAREDVVKAIQILPLRESLIVKLAIFCGMRPGEIFGMKWGQVSDNCLEVLRRVYRGLVDTPKTRRSVRMVGLPPGVVADLAFWRSVSKHAGGDDWVFPSENPSTPLSRDNLWRRNIQPKLAKVGLGWATFQVMRRTYSSLSRVAGADRKVVADQMGHGIGVNLDEYTIASLDQRAAATAKLEAYLLKTAETSTAVM